MTYATIAFAILSLAEPIAKQTLDFETKAASLQQVLANLSALSGECLRPTASIAHEVVFVHAKGIKLSELKEKLAEVVVGTWIEQKDATYLTRTPTQEKSIRAASISLRRKYVDIAMVGATKSIESPFSAMVLANGLLVLPTRQEVEQDPVASRSRYEREKTLFASGPRARLLQRLMLACNPNDLAAIGPFERVVFVSNPTRMQRGFDAKRLSDAFDAFNVEQREWIEEASKNSFPADPSGRMVSDPRSQLQMSPALDNFALEVRRGEMTSLFNANLLSGSDGSILSQASFADPARDFLNAQMTPIAPRKDDPIVVLSDDSKAFSDRIQAAFMGGQSVAPNARIRTLLTGIESNDPLSWTVSDALSAYSEVKKVNVVAAVPDLALSMAFLVSREQPLRALQFIDGLVQSGTVHRFESNGWVSIHPVDRFESAIDFTPRAAAAKLVKAVLSRGSMDLRDYARYAFESKRLNRSGFGDIFVALIDRSVLGTSDRTDWNSLCLYGSFSSDLQREMEAGRKFPFASMNAEQKKIVHRIAFAGPIQSERHLGSGSYLIGTSIEPTRAFPKGVPNDALVSARATNVPTLVAYGSVEDGTIRPLRSINEYTIATFEVKSADNPRLTESYGLANLVGYAPGNERMIAIRVEFAPTILKESSITIADYDIEAIPVPWSQLGEPFRKRIAHAIEQIKTQQANPPNRIVPPNQH